MVSADQNVSCHTCSCASSSSISLSAELMVSRRSSFSFLNSSRGERSSDTLGFAAALLRMRLFAVILLPVHSAGPALVTGLPRQLVCVHEGNFPGKCCSAILNQHSQHLAACITHIKLSQWMKRGVGIVMVNEAYSHCYLPSTQQIGSFTYQSI